jgi:hypothetical protein
MYLADVDPDGGGLHALEMVPFRICRFQLIRAAPDDAHWSNGGSRKQKACNDHRVEHGGSASRTTLQVKESATQ